MTKTDDEATLVNRATPINSRLMTGEDKKKVEALLDKMFKVRKNEPRDIMEKNR
jgi:hypothetical protein